MLTCPEIANLLRAEGALGIGATQSRYTRAFPPVKALSHSSAQASKRIV